MTAPVLKNRAGVATTTAGSGTVTLGAALGAATSVNQVSWQTLANAGVTNGQVVRYLILDSNGAWEYGTGTYTSAGTTLSRTLGGSSTGSLLSLSGSAQVFVAAVAEDIVPYDSVSGSLTVGGTTVTASTPVINLSQTWNNGAVAFTGMKYTLTATANAGLSSIFDFSGTTSNSIYAVSANLGSGVGGLPLGWLRMDGNVGGTQVGTSDNTSAIDSTFGTPLGYKTYNTGVFAWSNSNVWFGTLDLFLTRNAAATLQQGATDAAAPVAQTTAVQSVIAGTSDTAGADWILQGSKSTGAGRGGDIIFKTSPVGGAGTAQNAGIEVGRTGFMPVSTQQSTNISAPANSSTIVSTQYLIAASNTLTLGAGATLRII